jgi:hypothetical protein
VKPRACCPDLSVYVVLEQTSFQTLRKTEQHLPGENMGVPSQSIAGACIAKATESPRGPDGISDSTCSEKLRHPWNHHFITHSCFICVFQKANLSVL